MVATRTPLRPRFFRTASAFRTWLEAHHARATELLVGYYKKASGRASISYPESVDEALCFGWIDGHRRGLDDVSYAIRFTPRKPRSIWSKVNVARAVALRDRGLMRPAGLAAFERADPKRTGVYSFEQDKPQALSPAFLKKLRASAAAWAFFQAQPPGYRSIASFWVMSAKKEETRLRRLQTLIDDSAHGRRIAPLTSPSRSKTRSA